MVEYRLGSRAEAFSLKCDGFLLVYACHSFVVSNHRFLWVEVVEFQMDEGQSRSTVGRVLFREGG